MPLGRARPQVGLRPARSIGGRRAVVMLLFMTSVVAATVWAVLQQLNVGVVWKVLGAAVAAALPAAVVEVRARVDRREQIDRQIAGLMRLWTPPYGPRVRDVTDPVTLGVTPAAAINQPAEIPPVETVPPYVRRAVDDKLDSVLCQARCIVLVGDSKAGKSRTAFEAMHRHFSKRLLLAPASRQALPALVEAGVELPDAVLWLDELDSYLGADGLTVQVLEQLIQSGRVTVLGTIRTAPYARLRAEHEVTLLQRKVLERATVVELPRRLDADEKARAAKHAGDPRIAVALAQLHRYGLAEYLAAGPALLDRWRIGRSVDVEPVGAAIVAAAVDLRRAGRSTTVPHSLLAALYPVYLGGVRSAGQGTEHLVLHQKLYLHSHRRTRAGKAVTRAGCQDNATARATRVGGNTQSHRHRSVPATPHRSRAGRISRSWQPNAKTSRWRPWPNPGSACSG